MASGDERGNVIIWECWGTIPVRIRLDDALGGAIRDLAWSGDDRKVMAVGEG